MRSKDSPIRVLYSFPHQIGAARICETAWQQVVSISKAGAKVIVAPGVVKKPLPEEVEVQPTLALGHLRISYRLFGSLNACGLHDAVVARRLRGLVGQVDIVHTWPLGALQTLKVAEELGIPTVLERPNAHTRFAYQVVQAECDRLGVKLPRNHEHAFKADALEREEAEYRAAFRLLCPSDFVVKTFMDYGFKKERLARHIYGFDDVTFFPATAEVSRPKRGLVMLFVGVCAVRKGLHYALQAWFESGAHLHGTFLIAGEFLPAYQKKLAGWLKHPSVKVLGHRTDIPELMRESDVMVLPSIEEGFGLVCTEAMGSGCVPVVSEACTDLCKHLENAMVHAVGDVRALASHIRLLDTDRPLLSTLRCNGLKLVPEITWAAAGEQLCQVYRETVEACGRQAGKA
jgi:glycosyltransferase involved in cell wall biosynthesis